jgi:hypothetical protein
MPRRASDGEDRRFATTAASSLRFVTGAGSIDEVFAVWQLVYFDPSIHPTIHPLDAICLNLQLCCDFPFEVVR